MSLDLLHAFTKLIRLYYRSVALCISIDSEISFLALSNYGRGGLPLNPVPRKAREQQGRYQLYFRGPSPPSKDQDSKTVKVTYVLSTKVPCGTAFVAFLLDQYHDNACIQISPNTNVCMCVVDKP